jgi:hypothetical protein
METLARPIATTTVSPSLAHLSVDQFLCFEITCDDLRAVGDGGSATSDAIERLYTAFSRSTPSDWGLAVRAIDSVVSAAPANSTPNTRRLKQFVLENADLLAP